MNIKTIVGFIFSIIGILAVTSYLFPKEGIKLGSIQLRFPSLAEVMDTRNAADVIPEDTLTTEELLQLRLNTLKAEKESEFLSYCNSNAARIHMPGGNIEYFDAFFDALEKAEKTPLRIMHYGDSQLEGDRISSVLREAFQEKFGGNGVGLIPAIQTIPTYTLSQSANPEDMPRHLIYGPKEMRLDEGRDYGVLGQTTTVTDTTVSITFSTRSRETYPNASKFRIFTLMTGNKVEASVITGKDTLSLHESIINEKYYTYSIDFNTLRTGLTVLVKGSADIYGMTLDGSKGVSLDNIPMRGCSGTIFTGISEATLSPFFTQKNVQLIILQYGGNSVPYLKDSEDITEYMAALKRQIKYLRRIAPNVQILFIGPSDMATMINGEMQTYPMLPDVVEALKAMANEAGIAYWDLYAAMGGRGSMGKWVNDNLAGSDYIHFTPKGARHVGQILYETLEYYHKFYRFRTGKDTISINPDTLTTKSHE